MSTMTVTIGEFAALNGTDYQTAAGYIRFLAQAGVATTAGTRTAASGKGKPSTVYVIPVEAHLTHKAPLVQGELFAAPAPVAPAKDETLPLPAETPPAPSEDHPDDIVPKRLDFAEVA